MNEFLKSLDITFRRDPSNHRPRINKPNSIKDMAQKQAGTYFYLDTSAEGDSDDEGNKSSKPRREAKPDKVEKVQKVAKKAGKGKKGDDSDDEPTARPKTSVKGGAAAGKKAVPKTVGSDDEEPAPKSAAKTARPKTAVKKATPAPKKTVRPEDEDLEGEDLMNL